jgi:GTP cyclohydrolase I
MTLKTVLDKAQVEAAVRLMLKSVPGAVEKKEGILSGHLREGLKDTPTRFAKAWAHWIGGYAINTETLLKTFQDGAEGYDEMVLVKDIPFYSLCEHHLAPFFGRVTIGYLPQGKVVGLSKLARVVDAFARRLQVQERLTVQIANCIAAELEPLGVGVLVRARHLCMESRGVCLQGHSTTTQRLLGAMLDDMSARAEFMALAKSDAQI